MARERTWRGCVLSLHKDPAHAGAQLMLHRRHRRMRCWLAAFLTDTPARGYSRTGWTSLAGAAAPLPTRRRPHLPGGTAPFKVPTRQMYKANPQGTKGQNSSE